MKRPVAEKAAHGFGSAWCPRCGCQRYVYLVSGVGWRCSFGHLVGR